MADIVTMPKLGFDMAEGRLVRWVKSEGEPVQKGDVLAEIETDKATVEVEAAGSGILRRLLIDEGTSVAIGTPIAMIGSAEEPLEVPAPIPAASAGGSGPVPAPAAAPPVAEGSEGEGRLPLGVRASPLARRMAAARGLRLESIRGTGPGGRVTRRDVEGHAPERVAQAPERATVGKLRGLIGRRMTQAKQQVPHFYVTTEIDAGGLMGLREELNALLPDGSKISVNDLVVKAAALTLREHPHLNASFAGDQIVRHPSINIGVAVALDEGLITVVCREADRKPLQALSDEVRAMIQRARQGKVRPEEIEGSTFSVSNLGMFDVTHFIAIVNPPEAAILAVGSVRDLAVVRDGQVVPGKCMAVTLSADHRVTDGAQVARFLQDLKTLLEHPLRLVL